MPQTRLVAVSYPANEDYTKINQEVLGGEAPLVYLQAEAEAEAEGERAPLAARAEAILGWNPPGNSRPVPCSKPGRSSSSSCSRRSTRSISPRSPSACCWRAMSGRSPSRWPGLAAADVLVVSLPKDNPEFTAGIDTWWHEPRGGSPFRSASRSSSCRT
jgi:hypothetical protein